MFRRAMVTMSVGAVGLLGACGGSSSPPSASSPDVARLVSRAAGLKVDTMTVTLHSTVPGISGASPTTVAGTASLRLHPTLAGTLSFTVAGTTLNERIIGATIYVELPAIAARDGGRPWVAVNIGAASAAVGLNLTALLHQATSADPTSSLRLLLARGVFHQTGTTTIDGQQVVVLTGSFTPATLTSPVLSPQLVAQLKAKLEQLGATREDLTVYLTPAGLPVRIVTALTTTKYGTIAATEDIRDINAPVSVSPPPAAQTISLADARKLG